MKKWLSIAVTGILMAMCLAGCGAKEEKSSSKVASEATEAPRETEEASQTTGAPKKGKFWRVALREASCGD